MIAHGNDPSRIEYEACERVSTCDGWPELEETDRCSKCFALVDFQCSVHDELWEDAYATCKREVLEEVTL